MNSPDTAFEVEIRSSGKVVTVPDNCSIVEALSFEGIVIPTACEQGICGTCLTGVIDGVPLHKDAFLTAEERAANDRFTPCCSRATSARLVLDL